MMNVNPAITPGPASDVRFTTRAESQLVSLADQNRGDVRRSPAAALTESGNDQTKAIVDRGGRSVTADQQKAEQLRAFIGDASVRLNTYHDEASGRSILEVRDQVTGDVVSQYPSEELIRLYASLRQTLVDQSA